MTATTRQLLLKKIITSGYQISPDALDYILELESPEDLVEVILSENDSSKFPPVLSREFLIKLMEDTWPTKVIPETKPIEELKLGTLDIEYTEPLPATGRLSERIVILKNPEYDKVGSSGTIDDFLALFQDRFRRMKRIYMARIDTQSAVSPGTAKMRKSDARRGRLAQSNGERSSRAPNQTVLGIVSNKSVSASRNVIIELEDEEDSITCIVPSGVEGLRGNQLLERGNAVLPDEVVCISGYVDGDGRLIANDVIFPDIPTARTIGRATREVYAAFISDIHCGSKEFLEDEFDKFLNWLRGKDADTSDKEMIKRIDYVFVAGDMVDGIGVYPSQEEDLLIPDITAQYELIAKKFRKIPERIRIIAIPGNHDAARQALPKPPIQREFAESLYKLGDRILLMGDPCHIRVEGVDILLTHGDSMDDLVVNTPGASYVSPAIGMKELLRKRHLAPLYGGKTELAPLHRDWMVIDDPPDIVHFGHAHHNAVDNYRGVQVINSGTFQDQTDFMRKQGIVPTPGIVTIVNLRTGQPDIRFFYDLSKLNGQ
ncbi:MAG: DNA-directed DNA polymerase II small subunit [Candidatus Thorarchaeota archaeon]